MKRQVLLSVLAAIAIFAVTTTAEAGMFGRLSVIRGCAPCEPACAEAACDPCEKVAPCKAACDPCGEAACDCGCKRQFRPVRGILSSLRCKKAACVAACDPCEEVEAVECDPCEEVACDPCGKGHCQPFNGFFANLKNKVAAKFAECKAKRCNAGCDPCEPACEPCGSCK